MNRNLKIVIAVIAVAIIGAIGYFVFPKSYITMSVAPDKVKVSIDGGAAKTVMTGSTKLVVAGKHTYTISQDQFDSATITIDAKNNETKQLLIALKPQTDAASALLETNKSQAVVQAFYGAQQSSIQAALYKNYPILKDLPIYARLYAITSCKSQKYPNDQTKMALCVAVSQDGLEPYVRKDIASRGYNPDDYEIIYSTITDDSDLQQ